MSLFVATRRENTVCALIKCVISLLEVVLVRLPPLFIKLVCVKFEF